MGRDFSVGDVRGFGSAARVFASDEDDRQCDISQNDKEYWWDSGGFFHGNRLSGYIAKDSIPGRKITRMLEMEKPPAEINAYILRIAFAKVDLSVISDFIESVREAAFQEGRRAKAKEIREALEIRGF